MAIDPNRNLAGGFLESVATINVALCAVARAGHALLVGEVEAGVAAEADVEIGLVAGGAGWGSTALDARVTLRSVPWHAGCTHGGIVAGNAQIVGADDLALTVVESIRALALGAGAWVILRASNAVLDSAGVAEPIGARDCGIGCCTSGACGCAGYAGLARVLAGGAGVAGRVDIVASLTLGAHVVARARRTAWDSVAGHALVAAEAN